MASPSMSALSRPISPSSTGRALGQLVELGRAVEGEEAHTALIGGGDVALLLDGVAVGDPLWPDAERQAEIDLAQAGGVEAGAEARQPRQDLAGRIRLYGIEDAGGRQRLGERHEVMGHQVDIDHEAGRGQLGRLEIAGDARRHAAALGRQLGAVDERQRSLLGATSRAPQGQNGGGFLGNARTGTAARLRSKHRKHPFKTRHPAG